MNFETAAAPLENESDQQYRIFMQFALHQERNISQLARDFDIPISTLHRWKSEFSWDSRAATIDETVRSKFLAETGAESFQTAFRKMHAISETLLAKLETETQAAEIDKDKVDAIEKAGKAAERLVQLYTRTSWVDRVTETLKELHKQEVANQATEEDVKALLPKPSDRRRDPEDEDEKG